MRHLAWLDAVPEAKSSKKNAQATNETRREQLRRVSCDHVRLIMPDIDDAFSYLLAFLREEIGVAESGADGPIPVSFIELGAWQNATKLDLESWEILALKNLSSDYVSQFKKSSNPDTPAPFMPIEFDKTKVSDGIAKFFRSLIAQNAERKKQKG